MLHYNDGKAADNTGNRRVVLVVWVAENEGMPALEAMIAIHNVFIIRVATDFNPGFSAG